MAVSADAAANPHVRLAACERLIRFGLVETALPTLRNLAAVPECAGRATLLLRTGEYFVRRRLLDDLKPVDSQSQAVSQQGIPDRAATAFWRNPDPQHASQNLLIVFTGVLKHFWVSLDMLHRLLRHRFGQILYVRDFREMYYLAGVEGLGNDYASTLGRLKQIARTATVRKLYVVGSSAGGYAALRYGLDLGADAILALSPVTGSSVPEAVAKRLREARISLQDLDLLPVYMKAKKRPKVTLVYGAQHPQDSATAERFGHFAEFRLLGLPNVARHDVTAHLIAGGEFDHLLQELLTQ